MLSALDNNWSVVVANIWKDQNNWARISWILGQEGLDTRTEGVFLKVVVQVVLLFGPDLWVITPHIDRTLGGFNHQVDRRLMGK